MIALFELLFNDRRSGQLLHQLFLTLLNNEEDFDKSMREALTGEFGEARLGSVDFQYSPRLHIKTFRVAETYGNKVQHFQRHLHDYFK